MNVQGEMTRLAVRGDTEDARAARQGQVIDQLRALARSLRRQQVALAAGRGFPMSGAYFALLPEIAAHPGVTVSELARLTGLPKSRVSVLATRLLAERVVRKDPDEHDSRLVLLTLTEAGRRRAEEWSAASRQAIGRLLEPLSDEELAAIGSGLVTLQRAFRQAEEQGQEGQRTRGLPGGAPPC